MGEKPKISVLLSVFNGEKFIVPALESIVSQTYGDFEFIIINDGSTDQTEKKINSISDPRIVYVRNEKNLGLVNSLNKGLALVRGEFVARMDADDISYPNRFEEQIRFFEKNPTVGVLGTAARNIDVSGKKISEVYQPENHTEIFWKMFFGCAIIHPTVMIRYSVLKNFGFYDPAFKHIEDTELWSRLIFKTQFANLPEVFLEHRLHKDSIGSNQGDIQQEKGILILKNIIAQTIGIQEPSKEILEWFLDSGKVLTNKQKDEAEDLLKKIFIFLARHNNDGKNILLEKSYLEKRKVLFNAHRNVFLKKIKSFFWKILPMSARNKLANSKVGEKAKKFLNHS